MKLKNKIDIICEEIKAETPDVDIKYILNRANTFYLPNTSPTKRSIFSQRLIFRTAFSLLVIFIISISWIIGTRNNQFDEANNDSIYMSTSENIGLSSISIVNILNNSQDIYASNIDATESTASEDIDFLNRHLYSIELFMSSNLNHFETKESDLPKYKNLIVYTSQVTNIIYKVYINQINDSKKENLEVLVRFNDKEFILEGYKESKNLVLISYLDNNNYLKVTNTNNEYNYQFVNNNLTISQSKITLQKESNQNYVRLDKKLDNYTNLTFNIYESTNNTSLFNINYQITRNIIDNSESSPEQGSDDSDDSNSNYDGTKAGNIIVSILQEDDESYYSYSYIEDYNSSIILKERNIE